MQEREFKALQVLLKRDDLDLVRDFLKRSPSVSREEVLAQAAEAGAASTVRELLKLGANPNHHLPPALVLAIESGCHEVFDDLLAAGADLGTDPWWEDGDHPLASAAAMADPIAMQWLCEKGAAEIADPQWLWQTLTLLGSSRKKSSADTLVIFGQRLLGRLQAGTLEIETGPLNKAVGKLKRLAKKNRSSETKSLATSFAELMNESEAEEDEIMDLTEDSRFEDLLSFVRAGGAARRARRSGLALLYGIRASLWETFKVINGVRQKVPDPSAYVYLDRLLEMDPDVHVRDDMGRTSLMYAIWLEELDVFRKLVALGADLEAVDSESGWSVLGWARASSKPDEMAAWVEQAIQEKAADSGSSG